MGRAFCTLVLLIVAVVLVEYLYFPLVRHCLVRAYGWKDLYHLYAEVSYVWDSMCTLAILVVLMISCCLQFVKLKTWL